MRKIKALLSVLLILTVIISTLAIGAVGVKANSYEYAMFPMTTLNITQGTGGNYTHKGTLAIDIAGKDGGIESAYAPFSGTIKKIYKGYHVWLESSNPVVFADGTIDYMTVMLVHDNDTSDLYVGKPVKQGERFFEEGTAGYATGNHIHLEVAKGKMSGSGWYENAYGTWTITNAVNPFDALFLSDKTIVKKDYGYNWRYISQSAVNPFYDKTAVNLGNDFYAEINNCDTKMYVVNKNGNVETSSAFDMEGMSFMWRFIRQSDGSYVIYNSEDGNVLDVSGAGTTDGTNVGTYPYWEHDAQKWFIYQIGENQYAFKPKLCNLVLDVTGGSNESGTNIQLYTYNGSMAQLFEINTLPAVTSADVEIKAGDYKTSTIFNFTANEYAHTYTLTIYGGEKGAVTLYKVVENIKSTEYVEKLPAGYYEVYVEATNGYSSAKSEVKAFEVAPEPVVDKDGWTYSEKLFDDITEDKYDIEYKNTYDVVAESAPDDSYTKGDFYKTVYVNSGEPYWSNIELQTSATVELVDYYYYHFCGGGTGNNANFTSTNSYVHYDSISKDKVYVHSSNTDYDDSRYTYYHLKYNDGSDAYCNSNTTCDGTNGTHGNRSCYWYKNSLYQNKAACDLYHFSKVSDWVNEADATAQSVTYRYKLKESEKLLGDVNRDGKLNIKDATTTQKYIAKLVSEDVVDTTVADFNCDGKINIKDATAIQKKLVGLI